MNHRCEKLKMKECSNIIQNKSRAVLATCNFNKPHEELVFYDTDCFCGCISVFFDVCKSGDVIENLENNNSASLLITNKCNNIIEIVTLEGTLHTIEENDDCCCNRQNNRCFQKLEFKVSKVSGKRLIKC